MAIYEDISIDQGTDVLVRLELVNEDGTAKNLTNHSINGKIKKTYTSTDADEVVTFAAQIPSPASSGIINLQLTNSQTDAMKTGRWVYDVELSFVDSNANTIVERILEGKVTVNPSVTR
jgi:hypothetical protein